ncbi:MAG: ECF transporter S component, partial [Gorillibacterium sp.]|nr:ECF transporter S component [Gorillibacterium sp.]
PMYDILKPIGLQAEQLSYGMWFIAATFAFLLIRKPGVAILAEVAASSIETFFGGEWGVSTLVYGVLQGVGVEIILLLFLYRKTNLSVIMLASLGAAAFSLVVDKYYGYIEALSFWNYCLFIGLRLLGSVLIAGVFAYYLAAAVERTGVLKLIRPVAKSEYDSLG